MNVIFEDMIKRYPKIESVRKDILGAYKLLQESFSNNGKLLVAGNGGSAADAEHICGELMKGFMKKRCLDNAFYQSMKAIDENITDEIYSKLQGALPAIALTGHPALTTAIINDNDAQITYAQQLYGYGNPGDVFLAISTSGNSKNILSACVVARAKKLKVIGLTGKDGGKLKNYTDECIIAPEYETYKIQELHLPIYHTLCLMLEDEFFD